MATTLTVEESKWRITLSGELGSDPLPLSYIENLIKYENAIQALAGSFPDPTAEQLAANIEPESEEEFVYWPTTGTVTSKEIAAAWVIGESTWKQKVSQGIYPQPLEVESMKKLWDVPLATKALTYSGVQRRRVRQIGTEEADNDEK
jgi:hypothetical protein